MKKIKPCHDDVFPSSFVVLVFFVVKFFFLNSIVTPEDDYVAHRVELLNVAGQRLWRSGTLKARPSDTARVLDVSVRAKLLPPGSYVVQLQGLAADGQAEDIRKYSFKVVKP